MLYNQLLVRTTFVYIAIVLFLFLQALCLVCSIPLVWINFCVAAHFGDVLVLFFFV